MQSDRDLLAQWAGEELFAAGRADQEQDLRRRAQGKFYLDLMRWAPAQPQAIHQPTIIGRLLSEAFDRPGR
jgi:hypothetical protein